jgi:hypothetical protein
VRTHAHPLNPAPFTVNPEEPKWTEGTKSEEHESKIKPGPYRLLSW